MGLFSRVKDALGGVVGGVAGILGGGDIGDIIGGVGTGLAAQRLFEDIELPPEVQRSLQRQEAIAQALLDPNSAMFTELADEQGAVDRVSRDFAEALRLLGVENRRMAARTGGMGILNPERRDEAIAGAYARNITELQDAARQQARANARNYLSQAASVNAGVPMLAQPQMMTDQQNRQNEASGFEAILTGANNIFGGGNQTPMLNGNPNQLTINLGNSNRLTGPSIYRQ